MNINITPSAVAVDTAANLLAFLELAKDPGKLKSVIDQIKGAQTAAADEVAAAAEAKAKAAAAAADLDKKQASIDQESAKLKSANADIARKIDEANAISESAKAERVKFDAWMAAEREALTNDKSSVASAADQNGKRADALAREEASLAKRVEQVDAALAAAEAKRAEYEAKLAGLKAMVG